MATETTTTVAIPEVSVQTTQLRLASGRGPVTRTVLCTPLRDASPSEIPIIDISPIFSSSLSDRSGVAAQIRSAATNNGFFYITNHGISSDVIDAAYQGCLDFFRQPDNTKDLAHNRQSSYFNGWKPSRTTRVNPFESVDNRQSFGWTYDPEYDPSVTDPSSIPAHISQFLRTEKNGFPWTSTDSIPHFQTAVLTYWRATLALARKLVRAFALSLDLPEDFFDDKFAYPDASLALNYYPPLPPSATKESADEVSIGSHTDFQLFTILWQDASGGLQVLNRQGQWINAKPVPGTFVVNIGDYLQRITNDRYVSTVHRAQNRSGKERISMPFFFGFGMHESCGVLDTCVAEGETKKYEEINCREWVARRLRATHKTNFETVKES
ncbi:Clavaminate synthase-like protein [Coniochaeta ligniaria NRRL 30616]|uniref:Clavaminate synthase-like protein n=1 Tax=Coniochaeta ligniaria NRRL 30616 TaxID=1408157 RepID=A0A1J7J311_9PEZI|nr:Clavaminate synthase-like protein [Coniochaeta ligniaria NRRL 30616]